MSSSTTIPTIGRTHGTLGARLRSYEINGTVFAQTMFLVACNAGLTGAGAYLGRDLAPGLAFGAFLVALALILTMRKALRSSRALGLTWYYAIGTLVGASLGPSLDQYTQQHGGAVVATAGGLSMLFLAGFGAIGYLTSRDLSMLRVASLFGLIGLILFGVVLAFVSVPGSSLVYATFGLVVFAGWTVVDFQKLRRAGKVDVVQLALEIYLDLLNIFLLILRALGDS